MFRWEVSEVDGGSGQRRKWLEGRRRLLLLLFLLLAAITALWGLVRVRQAQMEADITSAIMEEEHVRRTGTVELADHLVDPAVPAGWRRRYRATFGTLPASAPAPQLLALTPQGKQVIATLQYSTGAGTWQTQRAYRQIDGRWRRTALPVERSGERITQPVGQFLLLRGQPADLQQVRAVLPPENVLDEGRQRLRHHWQSRCTGCRVVLNVEPRELEPPVYAAGGTILHLNTPPFTQPDFRSPLPPETQYQLAVTTALIGALTTPAGTRSTGDVAPRIAGSGDWPALLHLLHQTEARQWLLTEAQRRTLRNRWRAELEWRWQPPFDGPLPLHPARAPDAERRRWMMVALLLEHYLAQGDEHTIGRLAENLLAYDPATFRVERFFLALVGGSLTNLEQLAADYILTAEP